MKVLKKLLGMCLLSVVLGVSTIADEDIEKGEMLAFDRKKGNCLACHYVKSGTLMGNSGPAFVAMKKRFPKREELVAQISNPHANNPLSIMPPFGRHEILTQSEIELIVTWLYTL